MRDGDAWEAYAGGGWLASASSYLLIKQEVFNMSSHKNEQRMLKPGDRVVMNDNYHVSEENKGKVWTVCSEPWRCCDARSSSWKGIVAAIS